MKYEQAVCFTKKQVEERKRWLRNYLENVWDPKEEPHVAFDARLVELTQMKGRVTKKIMERRIWSNEGTRSRKIINALFMNKERS